MTASVSLFITLALLLLSRTTTESMEVSPIKSQCACGRCTVSIRKDDVEDSILALDCHCPSCRRFHSVPFCSFLETPHDKVTMEGEQIEEYTDECDSKTTTRFYCKTCSSKLASRIDDDHKIRINMGPLLDKTIPKDYVKKWKDRVQQATSSPAVWTLAQPKAQEEVAPVDLQGGCACGKYRYAVLNSEPTEFQHCYCHLCRQLSGGPFMTWLPVYKEEMLWNNEPPLVRTTSHGQRHICEVCRSILTIVYDEQPDLVWPAAGTLDDSVLPSTVESMSQCLYRVVHICCRYKQVWYQLPKDGLPRIQEAC